MSNNLPIVVDLDGTLIHADILMLCVRRFLKRSPLSAPLLTLWLLRGKCNLKARLAERTSIDAATLPFNEPLLGWLRLQKEQGRSIVLATATHRSLAEAATRNLQLFGEVFATELGSNLRGARKRDRLLARFGHGGFEYVGNEDADLAIWEVAAAAHVVTNSSRLLGKVRRLGKPGLVFSGPLSSTPSASTASPTAP